MLTSYTKSFNLYHVSDQLNVYLFLLIYHGICSWNYVSNQSYPPLYRGFTIDYHCL